MQLSNISDQWRTKSALDRKVYDVMTFHRSEEIVNTSDSSSTTEAEIVTVQDLSQHNTAEAVL